MNYINIKLTYIGQHAILNLIAAQTDYFRSPIDLFAQRLAYSAIFLASTQKSI